MCGIDVLTRFHLDCDPGHDDAVALLVAAKLLDLTGVSTVFGNSNIANTTRNALAILEAAELSIPVAKGVGKPLVDTAINAENVHGKSGLDGANLPPPTTKPLSISGPELIINSARQEDDLTVIAVAPLTNIATAIVDAPDIRDRIREISIMGGSTTFGNATPAAEFNIHADPEAAAIVFNSGIPIRMVGLNVTTTFGITVTQVQSLLASSGKLARAIGGALDFYLNKQQSLYRREYAPVHDVCAVVPYTHPALIRHENMHVDVECTGKFTRGQTVCDQRGLSAEEGLVPPQASNAAVAVQADGKSIIDLVMNTLQSYP